MRKIPTNSSKPSPRRTELPLDLAGPHVTQGAASQHRLYQALCHAIVGGIVKSGEPLPPSRALARQTGFRRNAVTTAYERLIADGFAVATVGSGTFVAARIPAQAGSPRRAKITIEPPQHSALSLGCTRIDERALQRFRAFAGRRLRAFGPEHLHYGDPRGNRELRAAIADHLLSARGLRCDPDQIMLASGTLHALRIVLSAILKPGDKVWCEDPGYPAARRAIEHCGYRPVSVPVDASGMVVGKGRTSAPAARAAYVTPSHQFPLGVQMSMQRRLELLDWAKDADAFVFEDDYDSEFRYDGAPLLSLAGIDHLRRVIYMGTFAKTLFPGLRIGYCALPEQLIGPVTAARAALDRFPGTLLEGAVADMLNSGAFAANLRKARKLYREARDILASTLAAASEGKLTVPVPSQGLHLVARLDPSTDPRIAAEAKAAACVGGWLLAETYHRARPLPGFVLGFSGHPVPQLVASAEQLARATLTALCAERGASAKPRPPIRIATG
ncbi:MULTISPECIES: PLP-dependent aminotransferase family protein [unclassified Bradyrhizobium]|uniref:MocR-like pyridoxine biosynthesis transcription factor PdxR n=1 Tax=unclassified Bradyrhizobium TaxID=2631580 RepID=UPI002478FE37|nr:MULTISPECIES: PLP-dependent aminotransferase family protein [unclassified Bradyrhizobium]WGS17660.1 PLP-dependent aminotransferase family protein [Bradyrhizobium sp. ISRA463]WGS24450.1 PLP-dependent aminotransferase family protein [Bradyrhizobium sp. ISRA464]